MTELRFSMKALAEHVADWYAKQYPNYRFVVMKLPRERKWKIARFCRVTNAPLGFQVD